MSDGSILIVAIVATVAAAVRSTWSPCSLSMLSTITPFGEASRGHRYSVTVAAFVIGAIGGGAVLGGLTAGLAAGVRAASPASRSLAVAAVAACTVAAAADLRLAGISLPTIPRQVDELWLQRYRGWVYGMGYGAQIGVGLATYVMTAAVYLMIVLGALTGRPVVAFSLGAGFGLTRGLAILLGIPLTTVTAAHRLHAWLEDARARSMHVVVATELVLAGVALGTIVGGWQATTLTGTLAVPLMVGFRVRRVAKQA